MLGNSLKQTYWQLASWIRKTKNRQWPLWKKYTLLSRQGANKAKSESFDYVKEMVLLAWEFPPQVTGGVYRPMSFANYAEQAGWKIRVITSPEPDNITDAGGYLLEKLSSTVQVQRISRVDNSPLSWPLPVLDGGLANAFIIYDLAARLMQNSSPGVILASGPPFHNFVVGMWLSKLLGWKLVLDYRDEWTECPFDFVLKDKSNRKLERQCLEQADAVVFTTPSQLEHAITEFDVLDKDNCAVVYNGWEPDDFKLANKLSNNESVSDNAATITLAYLGNLGPMASPTSFLTTLSRVLEKYPSLINRLNIKLIGYKRPSVLEQLKKFPYSEVFELIDQVPKSQACQMMLSVDALLLLNPAQVQRYIQGKTYEYVASRTPVLVYGEGGEMAAIINDLGNGLVIKADSVTALYNALLNIKSVSPEDDDKIEQWLLSRYRSRQAEQMFSVLEKVRATV